MGLGLDSGWESGDRGGRSDGRSSYGLGKIALAAELGCCYEFDEIALDDSGELALLQSGNTNHLHVDFRLCVFVFHRR
jgi:hypothetical protein